MDVLGFDFDGTGVREAEAGFGRVEKAATNVEQGVRKAERATDALSRTMGASAAASKRATDAIAPLSPHAINYNRALEQQAKLMRATQQAGLGLSRQFTDLAVQVGSGQSVFLALGQQLPQLADGLAVAKGQGVNFGQALKGMVGGINPLTVALGLVVGATVAMVAALESAEKAAARFDSVASGLGRTLGLSGGELMALADAAAATGRVSVASARDQAAAYAATGRIGGEMITNLIGLSRDYQIAFGVDASEATERLAKAMLEPDKAGREFTQTMGLLTQAQLAQIDAAIASGDQARAQQILFNELNQTIGSHADKVSSATSAWDDLTRGISNAWTAFGEWLKITDTEQIERLTGQIARMDRAGPAGADPRLRARLQADLTMLEYRQMVDEWDRDWSQRNARQNQEAQRTADQAARNRSRAVSGLSAEQRAQESLLRSSEEFIRSLEEQTETYGMSWQEIARYNAAQKVTALLVGGLTDQEFDLAAAIQSTTEAYIRRREALDGETLNPLGSVSLGEIGVRIDSDTIITKLEQAAERMRELQELANGLGQSLSQSFGQSGQALGDIISGLTGYRAEVARLFAEAGDDETKRAKAIESQGRMEIQLYGDLAGSAKQFFDEKSTAFKVLQGLEAGYRAFEMASSVAAIAQGWMETSQSVAQATTKGAADTAAGGAKIFSQLGMWAFPVVGAMLAVLGGLGGSGGSVSTPTALPETNTGAGTVLGDPGAQSESLTRSLEMAERYQSRDLEYSSRMVSSLRSIQDNIGSLTTAIARETGVGGGLNPGNLNLGTTTSGGFLGIGATTRSTDLIDQGITLDSGALADLISRGVSGGLYQLTQTTRTRSGFLGIGGSTRTYTDETRTGIGEGLSQEFVRVLASLRDGVLTAAGQLGLTGAEAVIDAFQVNLGRISFEGLSPAEISQTLNAVFSAVGDDMAATILPGLVAFQQAGEGLFETLSRLATEYRTVDVTLASIGLTFRTVGLESIEARSRLVELSGGLDAFIEGADFFAEAFLTDAQRIAPVQAAVTAELARLGVAADVSRTGFADLVMGLDVSTSAGAEMFAALMRLAPALDQVLTYQEEIGGVIATNTDLERQRRELEIRLMEAQGRISESLAARRADELAAIDATLRPMQEAVWAAQDMAQAATELAAAEQQAADAQRALASQRRALEIQLMEAQGNAVGALAARRDLEIAALDATLRPLQMAIYAALDLAAANDALAQAQADAAAAAEQAAQVAQALADQRRGLEIDLLDAQGRSAEAVAARRTLELEALDASLRPLQEAIFAALDLAEAAEALANAERLATEAAQAETERLAQIASQRRGLEIQLLEATGNAAGALAARREDELAALDASLRPIQEAIYAATDLAEANRLLADAQASAAEAARQEAERIASIARQQRGLDIALLDATGDSVGALAARRADELAALDASLRATQLAIYAAQDLASANEVASQAQQEAADAAGRLADQRRRLEIGLLEATGNAAGALAARRQDELAALEASLRPIQLQIYAAQDLASAQERAAERQANAARKAEEAARAYEERRQAAIQLVDDARSNLSSAYEREADALRTTIGTFRDFGASIREFRRNLDASAPGSASYATTRAAFQQTAALAQLGNAEALGGLTGASQAFLDAALANASSSTAYQRDLSLVKAALDAAAATTDRTASVAEQQLFALDASVSGLLTLNESVLSVRDAISALQLAMTGARRLGVTQFADGGVFTSPTMFRMGSGIGQLAEAGPEAIMPLVSGPNGLGVRAMGSSDNGETQVLRDEVRMLRTAIEQVAINTGRTARASERTKDTLDRVTDGGEAMQTREAA